MQAELLLLRVHPDRQELQLQQGQRLHEDWKRQVSEYIFALLKCFRDKPPQNGIKLFSYSYSDVGYKIL